MKKILSIIAGVALFSQIAFAQLSGGGVSAPNYFKKIGSAIIPVVASYTFGRNANRWDIFADVLDVTTLIVGSFTSDVTIENATPALIYKDTDGVDADDNGQIDGNLTDTGSGTEDFDMVLKQQIAGTLTAWLTSDADGNITFGSARPLVANGGGSLTGTWSDLGTVTTVDINGGTVDGTVIGGASAAAITGTNITANTAFLPDTNDGAALCSATLSCSDLFLANEAVINYNNGTETITHSTDALSFGGFTTIALGGASLTNANNVGLIDDGELQLGTGTDVRFLWDTADADAHYASLVLSGSNNLIVSADNNIDWTHANSTNPSIWLQSADQTTVADYLKFFHDQTDANIEVGAGDLLLNIAGNNLNPTTDVALDIGDATHELDSIFLDDLQFQSGTVSLTSSAGGLNLNLDLAVNGSDIITSGTGTAAVFNTNALAGNLFGAATTVAIGAATGTTTINNSLTIDDAVIYNNTVLDAATYTVLATDYFISVDHTAVAAVTNIELQTAQCDAAADEARVIRITDTGGNAGANNITITTQGAELISGAATAVINANYNSVSIYCHEADWFIF